MSEEIWARVPWADDYEASSAGRVRSWKKPGKPGKFGATEPKILTPGNTRGGYLKVALKDNSGSLKHACVHYVVISAFCGERPAGMQVCHNNGVRTDNRIENLRYDTCSGNHADREAHGTMLRGNDSIPSRMPELFRGSKNGRARLTEAIVLEMRNAYATGKYTPKQLAKEFGVTSGMANSVVTGDTWTHVGGFTAKLGNAGTRNPMCKISDETVEAIRRAHGTQKQIAARFRVSQSRVHDIRSGKSRLPKLQESPQTSTLSTDSVEVGE